MLFVTLGDTEGIGASCHFIKIGDTGLLLDAGADPEKEGSESLPRLDLIHRNTDWWVDHTVVTHAHHDHIGALPNIVQQFPHVLIHMTHATRQLADILLPASARLQLRRKREGSSLQEPLYTEEEINAYSYLYLAHETGEDFDLTGVRDQPPITARFFNAGHLLGAAGVLMTFEDDGQPRRAFYTSDTNLRSQAVIPGGEYPNDHVDVLILESTLAADPQAEMTSRKDEERRFTDTLTRVISAGGTVIIPVFALGRAQEILALVDLCKKHGLIDEDIPIYTAGSMRAVGDLYDKTRYTTPRVDPEFQVFGVTQRRLPKGEAAKMAALSEPSIHIVASGMMFDRTLSNLLAQNVVENEKDAILLVGFAKEDSPASRLAEAAAQGKGTPVVLSALRGPQPVQCHVERFRFSGHSHRRDLIQIVEMLQPRDVVLVHGEHDGKSWLADNIRFFYPDVNVHVPESGEVIRI